MKLDFTPAELSLLLALAPKWVSNMFKEKLGRELENSFIRDQQQAEKKIKKEKSKSKKRSVQFAASDSAAAAASAAKAGSEDASASKELEEREPPPPYEAHCFSNVNASSSRTSLVPPYREQS